MPINCLIKKHTNAAPAFIAIALSAIATPGITFGQTSQNQLKTNADSLAIVYADCVTNWVGDNLIASATPTEMATGGESKCFNKLQEFEEAQKNYLLSITPTGQENRAIEKAKSLASDVREMTRAHVIRLLIETRSGKPVQ